MAVLARPRRAGLGRNRRRRRDTAARRTGAHLHQEAGPGQRRRLLPLRGRRGRGLGGHFGRRASSRFSGDRAQLHHADGLHDDVVFGIVEDGRGDFWLSGNKGVTRSARTCARWSRARQAWAATRLRHRGRNEQQRVQRHRPARRSGGRGAAASSSRPPAASPGSTPAPPACNNLVLPGARRDGLVAARAHLPLAETVLVPPGRERWEIHFTALSPSWPCRRSSSSTASRGTTRNWLSPGCGGPPTTRGCPRGLHSQVKACNDDRARNDRAPRRRSASRPASGTPGSSAPWWRGC